jgi:hypothetical protein
LLAEIVKSNPLMKTDEMIELRKRLKAQNQGQSPVKGDSSAFMKTDSASPSPSATVPGVSDPVISTKPKSVIKDEPWNAQPAIFGATPRLGLNERQTTYISPSLQNEEDQRKKRFGY